MVSAGVYLFNTFLRKVELRRLFFNLTLIGVAAGFTQLVLVTGKPSENQACSTTLWRSYQVQMSLSLGSSCQAACIPVCTECVLLMRVYLMKRLP